MGRPPLGPEVVDRIEGSEVAKKRARVILEVTAGQRSVDSACDALGIGTTRFEELRAECLRGAVAALEPKPIGRPPQEEPKADERLVALEEENERLRVELVTSQVREELAIGLPHAARLKKKRKP